MSELQAIRQALYPELCQPTRAKPSRRQQQAERTRRQALSPRRIVLLLAAIPVVAFTTTISVYVRTSPFEPQLALRHLVALAGCEAAQVAGLAPARLGEPGYHARNDADLDGIACDQATAIASVAAPRDRQERNLPGSAKFIRP